MFRIEKFFLCLPINVAGFFVALIDLTLAVFTIKFADSKLRISPHLRDQPDVMRLIDFLIIIYAVFELVASCLVVIAIVKVIFIFLKL